MATQTNDAALPVARPQGPAGPVVQPLANEAAAPPDPRDVAASSKMPHIPGPVTGSSSKLSTITAALGYNRFQPKSFQPSTYHASFILLSLVLSAVDRIMINTYRFHQSNPDWHPVLSQIYYGILFVVHILRVRRSSQTLAPHESDFLEWFEGNWPFQSLPIAGPLKHFFQSITVTSGPSKFYGNISPSTPSFFNCQAANMYMPADFATHMHWPAIPLLMDIINDILVQGNRNNFATNDPSHWQRFFLPMTHVFTAAAPNEIMFSFSGMTDINYLPASSMPAFYESASNLMFPPRINSANTPAMTTIAEYLRLATTGTPHFTWFPSVIGMMQRHAQFLKDSTSLASITTVGLGACLPIITVSTNDRISLVNAANGQVIVPVAAVPATPAAGNVPATPGRAAGFRPTRFAHFNIQANSKSEDLHLLAEQFSILSCTSLSFTGLAPRGTHYIRIATDAETRNGPYWVLPNVRGHSEIDVLGQIVTFLTGAFHNDQRMNK